MRCVCVACGVEFSASPSAIKRGRKYCSHACNARVNFKLGESAPVKGSTFENFNSGEGQMTCKERESLEHDIWLAKIRKSIRQTGHAYKEDEFGNRLGEYDENGNFIEF